MKKSETKKSCATVPLKWYNTQIYGQPTYSNGIKVLHPEPIVQFQSLGVATILQNRFIDFRFDLGFYFEAGWNLKTLAMAQGILWLCLKTTGGGGGCTMDKQG
jgi:hypothetical protein